MIVIQFNIANSLKSQCKSQSFLSVIDMTLYYKVNLMMHIIKEHNEVDNQDVQPITSSISLQCGQYGFFGALTRDWSNTIERNIEIPQGITNQAFDQNCYNVLGIT